jgi:hypothetical protein
MSNPWQRRKALVAAALKGAPYVHPDYPEWTFTVRPASRFNADWSTAVQRLSVQPEYADLIKRQSAEGYVMSAEDRDLINNSTQAAAIEGCLESWAGVTDENDKPLEFTPDNVIALMAGFPEIALGVVSFANTPSNFKVPTPAAQAAIVEGNSPPVLLSLPVTGNAG